MAMTLAITDDCETTLDEDRRHETRTEDDCGVMAFEPFSGRSSRAESVNVSVGGMCLRMSADVRLRAGRFLSLRPLATHARFIDPLGDGRPARVVWVRPDPADADAQLVGVQLYSAAQSAAA